MKFRNVPVVSVVAAYEMFGLDFLKLPPPPSKKQQLNEDSIVSNGAQTNNLINSAAFPADLNYEQEEEEFDSIKRDRQAELVAKEQEFLQGIKDPLPVVRDNGDWIYKCALSAAKFNVSLRVERADRLWGDEEVSMDGNRVLPKRKSMKEDSEDDDFESDQEDGDDDGVPRKRYYRRKKGFFDVHTNITQVPAYTQTESVRVECEPIRFQDLMKPVEDKTETKLHFRDATACVSTATPANIDYWFGQKKQYSDSKYPLVLIPGQFKGAFPISK